eukprot:6077851-Prymnesium_polylepis.2
MDPLPCLALRAKDASRSAHVPCTPSASVRAWRVDSMQDPAGGGAADARARPRALRAAARPAPRPRR